MRLPSGPVALAMRESRALLLRPVLHAGGEQVDDRSDPFCAARALEIIARSDDFDAPTAERYGWINRAIPDAELDDHVDRLARRLASFDRDALAMAKRLLHRHAGVPADDYRETLAAPRELIVSPSTGARRAAVAQHAAGVGQDFDLRMGHHLGAVEAATPAVGE